MKQFLLWMFMAGLCLVANAETTNAPTQSLRQVDGKVYDSISNTNWIGFEAVCANVFNEGLMILTDEKPRAETDKPHLPWNTFILIRNYPTKTPPVMGAKLSGKIMKVGEGRLNGNGIHFQIWDCGKPVSK